MIPTLQTVPFLTPTSSVIPPIERGFTLVELLISLAIITMLTVVLYGGLRLGARAWDGVENYSQHIEELRLARGFLQRALRQVRSVYGLVDEKSMLLFAGDKEQLELIMPLTGFVGTGGLYLLRFARIHTRDGYNLIVQRWLVHRDITSGETQSIPQWKPLERPTAVTVPYDAPWGIYGVNLLLPKAGELSFSYFGPLADRQESDWQEEWKDRGNLPSLIKVSLGANLGWPDLIVALAGESVATNISIMPRSGP